MQNIAPHLSAAASDQRSDTGYRAANVVRARIAVDEPGGFTLIEVVVSMLLLAIIAVGLIPALIGFLTTSNENTNVATASQLVSQQIDVARSGAATCAALTSYKNAVIPPVVDARGVSFQPIRSSGACTTGTAAVVKVTVSVKLSGQSKTLASAVTYVYVTS